MEAATTPAAELAFETDGSNPSTSNNKTVHPDWGHIMQSYDQEYKRQVASIEDRMQRLVAQLLYGCRHADCKSQHCITGLRNATRIPTRNYTPRSARILALDLLSRPDCGAYICKYRQLDAQPAENARDEGPQDPSSFIQRLADTSCITELANGEAHVASKYDDSISHKAVAINRVLQKQCEPPFLPSGSSNPRFVSSREVADTIATALGLFYELLPEDSSPATWQSLAHHINSGRDSPSTTLDSEKDHSGLIQLLQTFSYEPYISLCAQICKVVALRTQVEDITAKFRQANSETTVHGSIISLLTERVTLIARSQSASKQESWIPWPYPLWFKKAFLKHWDGKPAGIWDRSNPDKTSDANILPYIYKRVDQTELLRSWTKHDPPVTTKSRHLLSFPFLYSDGQMLINFRMLNHLRMREAHKLSHLNEELFDRYIAGSDAASLEWDNRAPETQHLREFYLLLTVRRGCVLEDAFDQLWQRRRCELLRPLRVRLGEMEGHEVGQDLGGVQIEFFNLVCKAIFSEDVAMYTTDLITGLSYFRPGSLQPLYMFELFGLLVALAAYNGITIPVIFPLAFYKHLLDIPCTELRDIQDGWPDITRSLRSIKDGAYEGLDYVFPLEANGLRMSINHSAIDRVRAQSEEYRSGRRTSLSLSVEEMSRIESGASAASTNPYQPSDHQWPGWSIRAPRSGSQISVDDGGSTLDSTAPQTASQDAAQAEQPSVLNTLTTLAESDPKLKNLMAQVAANTATEDQLKALSNHVNRARAIVQAEKRKGKKPVAAETEKNAPSETTRLDQEEEQGPPSDSLTALSTPSYITDYTLWLTTLSILPQLDAFKKGFHALLPPHHLRPFTPPTLSLALQGAGPNLDLPALRRATQYKDYSPTDPYIQTFWRVVEKWPNEKRVALLRFVTAAERVPVVAGAGGLVFRVQRSGPGGHVGQGGFAGFAGQGGQGEFGDGGGQGTLNVAGEGGEEEEGEAGSEGGVRGGEEDVQMLPTSSTCFGTLYLPRYKDEETLERKLGIALEFGGVGFGTA
ncbi:hypothetical protein MBLNU13_g01010t2 [Cladosporium sp. NU13]